MIIKKRSSKKGAPCSFACAFFPFGREEVVVGADNVDKDEEEDEVGADDDREEDANEAELVEDKEVA